MALARGGLIWGTCSKNTFTQDTCIEPRGKQFGHYGTKSFLLSYSRGDARPVAMQYVQVIR